MDRHQTPVSQSHLGIAERIVSVAAGVGLLFHASGPKFRWLESAAGAYLIYRGIGGHCPIGEIAQDLVRKTMNINIRTSMQINRPVEEVYSFWRKLDNLPLFMEHIEEVG